MDVAMNYQGPVRCSSGGKGSEKKKVGGYVNFEATIDDYLLL